MEPRRIGVRGIAYHNGKLLSVLHRDHNGNPVDFWALPGGGLDPEEPLEQGIYREMIEETAIAPKIGKLLCVQQVMLPARSGNLRENIEFFFHIENPEDYATVDLSATTHGEQELVDIAWVDPTTTNILPAFLQTIDLDAYIADTKPAYIWNELSTK
jgi:8-oxo-dGTP diphosphatase